jgi:hypothetical protein
VGVIPARSQGRFTMSQRSIAFVYSWISENVDGNLFLDGKKSPRPKEFADRCRTEARAAGISMEEIEEEFGELEEVMGEAIDNVTDREIRRGSDRED